MSHPNRDRARELRANMTSAEKFVWGRIRREQLGYKFRRQQTLGAVHCGLRLLGAKVGA